MSMSSSSSDNISDHGALEDARRLQDVAEDKCREINDRISMVKGSRITPSTVATITTLVAIIFVTFIEALTLGFGFSYGLRKFSKSTKAIAFSISLVAAFILNTSFGASIWLGMLCKNKKERDSIIRGLEIERLGFENSQELLDAEIKAVDHFMKIISICRSLDRTRVDKTVYEQTVDIVREIIRYMRNNSIRNRNDLAFIFYDAAKYLGDQGMVSDYAFLCLYAASEGGNNIGQNIFNALCNLEGLVLGGGGYHQEIIVKLGLVIRDRKAGGPSNGEDDKIPQLEKVIEWINNDINDLENRTTAFQKESESLNVISLYQENVASFFGLQEQRHIMPHMRETKVSAILAWFLVNPLEDQFIEEVKWGYSDYYRAMDNFFDIYDNRYDFIIKEDALLQARDTTLLIMGKEMMDALIQRQKIRGEMRLKLFNFLITLIALELVTEDTVGDFEGLEYLMDEGFIIFCKDENYFAREYDDLDNTEKLVKEREFKEMMVEEKYNCKNAKEYYYIMEAMKAARDLRNYSWNVQMNKRKFIKFLETLKGYFESKIAKEDPSNPLLQIEN